MRLTIQGQAVWQGNRIGDFVDDVLAGRSPFKAALWLGNASPAAVQQADALGVDLRGKRLTLDPGTILKT